MNAGTLCVSQRITRRASGSGESGMKKVIVRFIREEAGQDIIEYAFLGMFISIVAVIAITNIGLDVDIFYTAIQGGTADAAAALP
jgi:Flp pilus assembly pilin Flp